MTKQRFPYLFNRQSLALIAAGALLIWLGVWLYNGGHADMSVLGDVLLITVGAWRLGVDITKSRVAMTLIGHMQERSPLGKFLQVMVFVALLYAALALTAVIVAWHWQWSAAVEVALFPLVIALTLEGLIQ